MGTRPVVHGWSGVLWLGGKDRNSTDKQISPRWCRLFREEMSWNRCLLSLSSITHCKHILKRPEMLPSIFFAMKSSLDQDHRLKTDRPDSRTWWNSIPAPPRLRSSHIKPLWGCYQAWVTQENKLFNDAVLHHIPSSPIFSNKMLEVFSCWWTRCSEPCNCTYFAFTLLDKIHRSVS